MTETTNAETAEMKQAAENADDESKPTEDEPAECYRELEALAAEDMTTIDGETRDDREARYINNGETYTLCGDCGFPVKDTTAAKVRHEDACPAEGDDVDPDLSEDERAELSGLVATDGGTDEDDDPDGGERECRADGCHERSRVRSSYCSDECYASDKGYTPGDVLDREGEAPEGRSERVDRGDGAVTDGGIDSAESTAALPAQYAAEVDRADASAETYRDTHTAHARNAAKETPGVRWYDPRDGQEHLTVPDARPIEKPTVTYARLDPYLPDEDGDDQYMTELQIVTPDTDGQVDVGNARHVFSSQAAARAYLGMTVPGYDDLPRADAVAERAE